jgi:hypothetical protein
MVFSDTSTEQGILQETRWLVGANATSYPTNDITRNVNRWFDKAVSLIFKSGGRWQWDDSNQTDLPIATTDLVLGQAEYGLEVSHLRIERVEVKTQQGTWVRLRPFDKRDVNTSIEDFNATAGTPQFYDVVANSVFVYPASSYAQDDSLKIWFQRRGAYFAVSDTTKAPGFAEIFHRYLSLGAAFDYALKNNLSNRNQLREEISAMEEEIKDFYALRQPDEHIRLSTRNSGKRLYK